MLPSIADILAFIEHNAHWAPVIFGAMAFGESLVLIGVLIPATTIMLACGALVGAGTLPLLPMWIGGAIGGALGDAVSYGLGRWLGPEAHRHWPFTRYPAAMRTGETMFRRWGWIAVFGGRFIGPVRAFIPLIAGIFGMPNGVFQVLNITSAIVWIPVIVIPGVVAGRVWELFANGHTGAAIAIAVAALLLAAAAWMAWRRWGHRLAATDGEDAGEP